MGLQHLQPWNQLNGVVSFFASTDYVGGKENQFHFIMFSFFIADPGGGINQIPAECTVSGDVRFITLSNPFEYRPLTEMMSY